MLAHRLRRHGWALTGALPAAPQLPVTLATAAIETGRSVLAGRAVAGLVSAEVITLSKGVVRAMFFRQLKTLTAALVVVGAFGLNGPLERVFGEERPGPCAGDPLRGDLLQHEHDLRQPSQGCRVVGQHLRGHGQPGRLLRAALRRRQVGHWLWGVPAAQQKGQDGLKDGRPAVVGEPPERGRGIGSPVATAGAQRPGHDPVPGVEVRPDVEVEMLVGDDRRGRYARAGGDVVRGEPGQEPRLNEYAVGARPLAEAQCLLNVPVLPELRGTLPAPCTGAEVGRGSPGRLVVPPRGRVSVMLDQPAGAAPAPVGRTVRGVSHAVGVRGGHGVLAALLVGPTGGGPHQDLNSGNERISSPTTLPEPGAGRKSDLTVARRRRGRYGVARHE